MILRLKLRLSWQSKIEMVECAQGLTDLTGICWGSGWSMSVTSEYFHIGDKICFCYLKNLKKDIISRKKISPPYPNLTFFDDPKLHYIAAEVWSKEHISNENLSLISVIWNCNQKTQTSIKIVQIPLLLSHQRQL